MEMLLDAPRSEAPLMPNPGGLILAHSVDEALDVVGRTLSPHKLKVSGDAECAHASLSCLPLGDCSVVSLQYGFDVDIDAGHMDDWYMVKLTLSGEGRVVSGEHRGISSCRAVFMTSPQEDTHFWMSASCRHLTTRVSRQVVEERLMQKIGRRLDRPLEFDFQIASDSDFGRAWWQLARHICEISATAPAVLACEAVRSQYSRTLIELLLHAAPHTYSEALGQVERQRLPRFVRRAQEYIAAHVAEIRSVAELAAAIGVSPRTLQNGFKQTLDMSPVEYVRKTRIRALHQALLAAEPPQSVTSLMTSVGISSFGRYAEYYRQQIGVPPSQTLRRA